MLIGEGEAFVNGARVAGDKALAAAGLKPATLEPKEGLALLNGTQVSTALALDALITAERNIKAARSHTHISRNPPGDHRPIRRIGAHIPWL